MNRRTKGQALLLTTLSVTCVFGAVGMAVDLGWGYYLQKLDQSAADAAAISAASSALETLGQTATPVCGGNVQCQSYTQCPASGSLQAGCLYAAQNGVTPGGANGRQGIQLSAGTSSTAPNLSHVPNLSYWVQSIATQSSPQLFSAVLGKQTLNVAARATAGIYSTNVTPSVFLLNRNTDCFTSAITLGVVCGEDFLTAVTARLVAPGGIYMASTNSALSISLLSGVGVAAGTIVGAASVTAPFTQIQGGGGIQTLGGSSWSATPKNGYPDGEHFRDPMRGKGQPPMPTGLVDRPVPGGIITGNLLGGTKQLPPGNYYATLPITGQPSGLPITILGSVQFTDGASNPCSGFCQYVFYGGLVTASLSSVTFSPGEYVFAGSQIVSGGPGTALSIGANAAIKDLTPMSGSTITQNSDAGELFYFTSSSNPSLSLPISLKNAGVTFPQAIAGLQGGLGYTAVLHGLNSSSSAVPSDLKPFAPVLLWQDQASTTVKYKSDGSLDISCGSVCSNLVSVNGSQQMILQASQSGGHAGVNLYGTIYSPRGAYITVLGLLPNDAIAGPLQIITGALEMALNSKLDLSVLPTPPSRRVVSLIE